MSDVFDPNTFMASNTAEAGSTVVEPIPAGDYTAIIEEVTPRSVQTKTGTGIVLDVLYALQAPDIQAKLGRQKLQVKQGLFLDVNPSGGLDMSKGKNVQLNRIRAAVGQNEAGKTWNLTMLRGAGPLKVNVKLRPDKNSPDIIYNDVASVGKM